MGRMDSAQDIVAEETAAGHDHGRDSGRDSGRGSKTAAGDMVAPDAESLARATRALLDELPAAVSARYAALPIEVRDLPEPERLSTLGIEDPFDLIGHFESGPKETTAENASETPCAIDPVLAPSRLTVFRRPLLDYWIERGGSLREALSGVLLTEIERRLAAQSETSTR